MASEEKTEDRPVDRKHVHPIADGGTKYREPVHADADRSEVPHDYEGPTKLERVATRQPNTKGLVTEMVEVPDEKAKALQEREERRRQPPNWVEVWEEMMDEDLPDEAATGTMKTAQEKLEDRLDETGWDPLGGREVSKADDEVVKPDEWTEEDFREARMSPEERQEDVLRSILGELHALNRKLEYGDLPGDSDGDGANPYANMDPVELLERIEERLDEQLAEA